ncbi:hypothetical protein BGZ65_007193 [Modicella reniformis]|uniref:Uncharacterized protein n=1 Tax=Modicella reniformis TaxID=1440133 RepID=A0A9P6IVT4_9FUNG|nr:hypothetical protein BGZ65_007193 [Modicella reniformis]
MFGPPPQTASTVTSRLLEEYALNPESRLEVVKSCNPGTRESYLLQLRQLSQELQSSATAITDEKIQQAVDFLHQAVTSIPTPLTAAEIDQFRTQFALLGFLVKPILLQTHLQFNLDKVTQLTSKFHTFVKDDSTLNKSKLESFCDRLPTALDESMISTKAMISRTMDDLNWHIYATNVPALAWPLLLAEPKMEDLLIQTVAPPYLLNLFRMMQVGCSPKSLEIIEQADIARIDELVAKVVLRLYKEKLLSFAETNTTQLKRLTRAQLEMISVWEPSVMTDEGFVGLLEKRILPREFATPEEKSHGVVHREWLERMIVFVNTLAPKFNRHKLSVYLMSLEFDLAKGVMDKQKFLRQVSYIAIPRNHNSNTLKTLESSFVVNFAMDGKLEYWSDRVQPASKSRDEEVVKEYISHFIRLEKSVTDYEPYFDLNTYLNPVLARVMLTCGDQNVHEWSRMLLYPENLTKLTEQTIIKFAHDNPESFLPSDPVVFKLKVKNAKRVLVRVFEVKTLEYLLQYTGTVGQDLNLDGLTPNWEHNITLDHPPLEIRDLLIELPELAGRRGSFVMDVISNGENSSAYFTKGYLDYIERQSVAGHVLTIIDENQQKISEDIGVWLGGFHYKANEDGNIVIPYGRTLGSTKDTIFITHKEFTSRRSFKRSQETYEMLLSYHVNHESLMGGSTAKVLLRPIVKICSADVICPVDLLEQVVLEVIPVTQRVPQQCLILRSTTPIGQSTTSKSQKISLGWNLRFLRRSRISPQEHLKS